MRKCYAYPLASLLGCFIAGGAFAQDGNNPPRVEIVGWQVDRYGGIYTVYDRDAGIGSRGGILRFQHEELDQITVTIEVTDADWQIPDPDQTNDEDRQYFVRMDANGVVSVYPPQAPPIPASFPEVFGPDYHGAGNGVGFAPPTNSNVATLDISFEVPEFIGRSQARLRGNRTWDVAWNLEFRVSNEESPGEEVVVDVDRQGFGAIESALLPPSNPPPFADAGPDQTVATGTIVTLDASRSFEGFNTGFNSNSPDIFEKDEVEFVWEYVSCTCGLSSNAVNIVHESINEPTARVRLDATGEYVFRVTVDDGFNAEPRQDSVMVTVLDELPVNRPPAARITGPASAVPLDSTVMLTAEASSDPDDDELTYSWRQTNELGLPLELDEVQDVFQPVTGAGDISIMWQAVSEGTFYFRLLVSDGEFVSTSRFTVEVVEPETAGISVKNDTSTSGDSAASAGDNPPAADFGPVAPLCGAGLAPAMLAPLAILLIRRR